jgi:hypothetical protein
MKKYTAKLLPAERTKSKAAAIVAQEDVLLGLVALGSSAVTSETDGLLGEVMIMHGGKKLVDARDRVHGRDEKFPKSSLIAW